MTVAAAPAGLTPAEVEERMRDGRVNHLPPPATATIPQILRENLATLFNAILTVCFLAVVVLGDIRDGLFYLIVVANAVIGIAQQIRAKRVLDRAALLVTPEARVRRGGETLTIPLEQVVLDDVLVLMPGDQITADARVLEETGLAADESLLTGESDAVEKPVDAALLSGSHVSAGTGYAVVTAVGADSYASRLTSEIRRPTKVVSELQGATNRVLLWLTWILPPFILLSVIGRAILYGRVLQGPAPWNRAASDIVASVVGIIPEGLVLLTSLAFAAAAVDLARSRVLVQEPAAVEVLARVDVICLDKTGTLTTGELRLEDVVVEDPAHADRVRKVLAAFGADDMANATAQVFRGAAPLDEVAVLARIPFSSTTKTSGISLRIGADASTWTLGAPEYVIPDGTPIRARAAELAAGGKRVVALARTDAGADAPAAGPIALAVIGETVRAEAADTLAYFRTQGIRIVIISGDNPATVGALGATIGLTGDVVDASTLAGVADLPSEGTLVLGRVTPEQKRDIVAELQSRGSVVAMTGDGVNDSAAVKLADLGIAMGDGTAATKAASRLVLLDNRFDRLPRVLAASRRVVANVERVATFFLAKTVYGLVFGVVAAVLVIPFPFLPRQLALVSGLTIGLPAFVLALAPNSRRYTPGMLRRVVTVSIPVGVIAAATALSAFLVVRSGGTLHEARTAATVALFLVSLWIVCVLARPLTWRRLLLLGVSVAAMAISLFTPIGALFFDVSSLGGALWLPPLIAGAAGCFLVEIVYRIADARGVIAGRERASSVSRAESA